MELIRLGLLAVLTISFVAVSCGSQMQQPIVTNSLAAQSPIPKGTPSSFKSIRDVDFKNFTYGWYPSYLKAPSGIRQLTLKDGEFEVREDENAGIDNLSLELQDISYMRFGKSQEFALVTVSGVETFNSFVGSVFLYGLESGNPVMLWQHEIGDRANGGLRLLATKGKTLILEQYLHTEDDGGLCCPKWFIRHYYGFSGRGMKETKSQRLANTYETAEFLGYPSDKQ